VHVIYAGVLLVLVDVSAKLRWLFVEAIRALTTEVHTSVFNSDYFVPLSKYILRATEDSYHVSTAADHFFYSLNR
jgi:hypothetical protein